MAKTILITGGAGFVGSHVADELLRCGYRVRVLDNLSPQVHGGSKVRPNYLASDVELQQGDVTDPRAIWRALDGVDAVLHLAATVGVGQSMYQIERYTTANATGTAVLLEALAKRPVERLVVASSMSIYGEGAYRRADGAAAEAVSRTAHQLRARHWEVTDSEGEPLVPVPTPETKRPELASIYALSKYYQERACLTVGAAYEIPTVALRFFNIYGTRQALSNPYTGVLAIFASRLLNGNRPLVNEDGEQRRDFVNVRDVARACRLALEAENVAGEVFNVGSGRAMSVSEVAVAMARALDKRAIEPDITQRFRVGDIRNCFADISHARAGLGYEPAVSFEDGIQELAEWLENQTADDRVIDAANELLTRGLAA